MDSIQNMRSVPDFAEQMMKNIANGTNKMSEISEYVLISPKQLYNRINHELDEPIGLSTIYKLVKQKDFPSVKIGGRFFVIENKVEAWLQSLSAKRKQ